MLRIMLVAIALIASGGATAASEVLPVKLFAQLPQFRSVKISPTGDYLAASIPIKGRRSLAFLSLPDLKVVATVTVETTYEVADYWWVGERRVVAALSRAYGSLERPSLTGDLIAVDVDGKNQRALLGKRAEQTLWTAGYASMLLPIVEGQPGKFLVDYSPTQTSRMERTGLVKLIDSMTGQQKEVARAPQVGPMSFLADHQGRVRFAVGSTEDLMDSRSFAYDVEQDKWNAFSMMGARTVPLAISRDGQRVWIGAGVGPGKRDCLLEQSSVTGESRQLACHPEGSLDGIVMSSDRGEVLAAQFEAGFPELVYVQPDHPDAKLLRSLESSFPGKVITARSWTHDGSKLVFRVGSDREPGEYYLYDAKKEEARFLMAAYAGIDAKLMAERRPITYKARDGQVIHAYLTLPPGRPGTKLPMVTMPHGGPFGIRDDWFWDSDAQFLASRGYAVLQPNFRGSEGYGETFRRDGRYGWGTVMINDITDGTRWAVEQGIADASRLCIYGASYGGYASLMSAVREPDLYRCAIGYVGVYDIDLLMSASDIGQSDRGETYLQNWVGKTRADRDAQSPIFQLDKLKAALFISHGEDDERAPYVGAVQLRKALDKRKVPYEWMAKPNEGHGYYEEGNRAEMLERMEAFLGRHIGAAPATTSPTDD